MSAVPEAPRGRAWGVAALLLAASDALQARFGACTVQGELSGFTRAGSGHCYFTLKDGGGAPAALRCAMFRRAAGLLSFTPRDGQKVELRGRMAVYEARGELQFVVESMQPLGAGALYEEFLRLKARLEAAGLFDAAHKRPLPTHPRAVGVVTSTAAAALHDVLTALARRAPHVPVVVYPTPVQGAQAPQAIAEALALAGQRGEVDLLILCRGGGSLEDLWAFNDERVVRTLRACALPVVCGVGHETDLTLADLAADLRAPTPTAAAELAAPATAALLDGLDGLRHRAVRAVHRLLEGRALRLDQLGLRLARPAARLQREQHALAQWSARRHQVLMRRLQREQDRQTELAGRLQRAVHAKLGQQAERLLAREQRLQALDPHHVLRRGFAWVTDTDGRVLQAADIAPGQTLRTVWHDGQAESVVTKTTPVDGAA
ncbi:exodeoxyribonuclease VII large subunit [Aquabacterium sp. J223]|uniref:exodeoxyribonuclease VII large subunit n=1 Tax=Aquabacterium sp. J223 TaxID=2898431 RepID=UPI0021AD70CD|nr:exodeoxyribonuclease VII large subunit [Aquabacterium sp. J223]UUX94676.1 exodeoxyribonuclease VII large subunit [Aquabacterium sp. J223]